jgi:hypothetical protein
MRLPLGKRNSMLSSVLLVLLALVQVTPQPVPVIGRIVDPEDRAVEGARVLFVSDKNLDIAECREDFQSPTCYEALTREGLVRGEGTTGRDGKFTIPFPGGLRGDDYILVQGKDLRGTRLATSWPVGPNRKISSPDLGDVRLERWRELLIIIRADGQPVSGAGLDFGFGESKTTDKNGEYRHGMYTSDDESVWHVAFAVRARGFAVEARSHGLRAGSATMTIDLVKDVELNGRVIGPDAQPIPKAVVTVRPTECWCIVMTRPSDEQVTQVFADAEGHFTARGLRLDREYNLSVEAPAELAAVRAALIVKGGAKPVDVKLAPAGEVLVEGEYPPAAATSYNRARLEYQVLKRPQGPVRLERLNPATGGWENAGALFRVEEAQPGYFRIRYTQVPAGPVRVTVEEGWSGVAGEVSHPFPVTVGVTAPLSLKLVMERTLRLQVIDTNGKPVPDATLEWPLPQADSFSSERTDMEGRVEIKVHPSRSLDIKVTTGDGREIHHSVPAGVTPPPIVLPAR